MLWYTQAIETRRAERDQITQEAAQQNTNAEAEAASDSELDQQIGSQTPLPTISRNPKPSTASQSWKTPKIADKNEYNPDFMTPQKILLNSIEKVREAWLVDQKKLARTPAAKRAEREQKVRVLMSMRWSSKKWVCEIHTFLRSEWRKRAEKKRMAPRISSSDDSISY